MAVKRLHLVLRRRHLAKELPYTLRAFVRRTIPREGGRWAVEIWKVLDPGVRIVCRVVEAGEVVRCACGDLNANR